MITLKKTTIQILMSSRRRKGVDGAAGLGIGMPHCVGGEGAAGRKQMCPGGHCRRLDLCLHESNISTTNLGSRLKNKASHKCITGIGSCTIRKCSSVYEWVS